MTAAPVTLLPYQSSWVRDGAGLQVIEKSRRIGVSWAEAYRAVVHAGGERGGGNVYYQSYAKDMARGFISDVADWAERLQAGAGAAEEALIELDDRTAVGAWRVRMASGREVVAMSSAPRAFRSRGRPGDRAVIDEAAHVDDLDEVLAAAMAFRMWGGKVAVMSTHAGAESAFAGLVDAVRTGERPGSLHTVTLRDALGAGLYRRICAITGEAWSPAGEEAWEADVRATYGDRASEELDCVPAAGTGAWLPIELIRDAEAVSHPGAWEEVEHGRRWRREPGHRPAAAVLGVDVARRRDYWVAVALSPPPMRVLELVELRGAPFGHQGDVVARLLDEWRVWSARVDQTGMGEALTEEWQRRFGAHRIEGVLLTPAARYSMGVQTRDVFEAGGIGVPPDRRVRQSLNMVRRAAAPGGGIRLVVPDTHGDKGHADHFWALALAVSAASDPMPAFALHRAPPGGAVGGWIADRLGRLGRRGGAPSVRRTGVW